MSYFKKEKPLKAGAAVLPQANLQLTSGRASSIPVPHCNLEQQTHPKQEQGERDPRAANVAQAGSILGRTISHGVSSCPRIWLS